MKNLIINFFFAISLVILGSNAKASVVVNSATVDTTVVNATNITASMLYNATFTNGSGYHDTVITSFYLVDQITMNVLSGTNTIGSNLQVNTLPFSVTTGITPNMHLQLKADVLIWRVDSLNNIVALDSSFTLNGPVFYTDCINPTVGLNINQTICNGQSVTLIASGGSTYAWSPATGLNVTNNDTVIANPSVTTTYSVTVNSQYGCPSTSSTTITVSAGANLTAITNQNVCTGQSATLVTSGATTYAWSPATGLNVTNNDTVIATPSVTTTYTVTGTTGSCPASTQTVTVTVGTVASASITANPSSATICAGTSITLTASTGTSYSWSGGQITQAIVVSPATTTTYTVTVVTGCGNPTATQTVTVNPLPVAVVTPSSVNVTCGAGTIVVGSGGTSSSWNTGELTASITISTIGTHIYTATNACGSDTQSVVATNGPMIITVVLNYSGTQALCPTGPLSHITLNVDSSAPGATHHWMKNGVPTGQTSNSITVYYAYPGTYTVIDSLGTCSGTPSVGVTVTQSVLITGVITSIPASLLPTTAGLIKRCNNGSTMTLYAPGGASYLWNNGDTTSFRIITGGGSYSVTVSNANGCSSSFSVTVQDIAVPTGMIMPINPSVCEGGTLTLMAPMAGSYSFNLGSTTQTQIVPTSVVGSMIVSVILTSNGCQTTLYDTVTVNPNPTVGITVTPSTTACAGTTVTLAASSSATNYSWSNGHSTNSIFTNLPGSFSVTAIDATTGCYTASSTVSIYYLPGLTAAAQDLGWGAYKAVISGGVAPFTYTWDSAGTTIATSESFSFHANQQFTLTVTDVNGCSDVFNGTAIVPVGTGIENVAALMGITVGPNPFRESTQINFSLEGKHMIELYDMIGRKIQQMSSDENQKNVSIAGDELSEGVYLLKISNEKGEAVNLRIVKQH